MEQQQQQPQCLSLSQNKCKKCKRISINKATTRMQQKRRPTYLNLSTF